MASRYNLTPERKEKLKKEVMAEIGQNNTSRMKPQRREEIPLKTVIQPKVVNVVEKKVVTKPIIKKEIKKIEIKKEVKIPGKKPEPVKPTIAKSVRKKPRKVAKKSVRKIVKPLKTVKVEKKVIPAPSPIAKKVVTSAERDLFFKPDSFVKPADYKHVFKPKVKIGNRKMFVWGIIVCVILGIILALVVNIFGIYKLDWNGQVSKTVMKVLPLPAGTVDGRVIRLSDYYNDLNVLKTVTASDPSNVAIESDQVKDQLFNRLVSVSIMEEELRKYGKSVTDEMINEEMKKVVDKIGSEEKTVEDIKNIYGMDIPTFKNNVLKPIISMDILSQLITSDDSLEINTEAKRNADDALRLALEPGTDFKTLVLQYANDPTTLNQSGDMGWFSKGELPQEIESALFSLKDGEVYNQVVRDDYGYHIYKVESKLADKDSGKESIKINQIFITVNPELYIKSLFDKAVIKKFI